MMMMSVSERNRYPFTASQWEELEQQALVFKYIVSGMQIPPDLIFTLRTSFDFSLSTKLLFRHHQFGWNGFNVGRKMDPEPGKCRRTDGKKWRCSKDAYPDSKYCERHMHRGRNRSRKPVEISSSSSSPATIAEKFSAINNIPSPELQFLHHHHHHHRPSYLSSSTPGFIGLSPLQENKVDAKFFLESSDFTRSSHEPNYCRNRHGYEEGMKGETDQEHAFLSQANYRNGRIGDGTEKVENENGFSEAQQQLTVGFSLSQLKDHKKPYYSFSSSSGFDINGRQQNLKNHYYYTINESDNYNNSANVNDDHPKKVMHHFLDECPSHHSNCPISSEDHFSITNMINNTQLSMSVPKNPLHDFFMTHKW